MSNPITPYYAFTPKGNIVWVSEFNDECANAEVKFLYAIIGKTTSGRPRIYHAGDVKVVPKYKLGLLTAVSYEVASDFLTIKRGALSL